MSSTSPKTTKTTTPKSTRSSATKTTAKKTTAAKTAKKATATKTTRKTTAKTASEPVPAKLASLSVMQPAPQAVVPEPKLAQSVSGGPAVPAMRKKELVDTVTARLGAKKKDVKPVVEAMLQVLGEAIAEDRELNLPPFAKLRIQRVKQTVSARVTIAKLRQSVPAVKDAAE